MKFKELREKYRSKFPASLVSAAVKIAIDMGGNMTGAYKKIEKMKRGLGDDPIVKDALRLANENVNEETLNELNFSYAFFDKQSLNKFMMKALKLKGLEVVDSEKQTGGHYTVRVKSDDKKIIAKANSIAIKAMSEWVEEVNSISEMTHKFAIDKVSNLSKAEKIAKKLGLKYDSETGKDHYYLSVDSGGDNNAMMKFIKATSGFSEQVNEQVISEALSKKISDAEARKIQKKYNLAMDQFQDLKNDYSPKKTPRPKAWLSLDYPVRDGDYYFAFVSDDEKKNTKFNSKLNDVLRNVGRGRIVGGINKATELADEIWAAVSKEVKKYPKDLGWNDTMTREEIWASIGHMIAAPGFKEEIEEVVIDKMRIGKRKKAPKWS